MIVKKLYVHNNVLFSCISFVIVIPFLILLNLLEIASNGINISEITELITSGNYDRIISICDEALKENREDPLAYFYRGNAYLAKGQHNGALGDFSNAILYSDYNESYSATRELALMNRARLYRRLGVFSEASQDYDQYLVLRPDSSEAQSQKEKSINSDILLDKARTLSQQNKCEEALPILKELVLNSPISQKIHTLMAECYISLNDLEMAAVSYRYVAQILPDPSEIFLLLAKIYFSSGKLDPGLVCLRNCTHYNPDHKICGKFFRHMKDYHKRLIEIDDTYGKGKAEVYTSKLKEFLNDMESKKLNENDPFWDPKLTNPYMSFIQKTVEKLCDAFLKTSDSPSSVRWCKRLSDSEPENIEYIIKLVDAYIANEDYDTASDFLKGIQKKVPDNEKIEEAIKKIENSKKKSSQKDYYQILELDSRDVDDAEIRKAYRKLARKFHPDRNPDDEKAAKRFTEVNKAYEVLSDREKRRKYDQFGVDMDDPHQAGAGAGFGGGGAAGFDMADILRHFAFGGGGGFQRGGGRGGGRSGHSQFQRGGGQRFRRQRQDSGNNNDGSDEGGGRGGRNPFESFFGNPFGGFGMHFDL